MPEPGERIPREILLHEIARALRASFPDRAEEFLRELEKRLVREAPAASRPMTAIARLSSARALGDPELGDIAEAVITLVNDVEGRTANPRWRWSVDLSIDPHTREVAIDVRAKPRERSRR